MWFVVLVRVRRPLFPSVGSAGEIIPSFFFSVGGLEHYQLDVLPAADATAPLPLPLRLRILYSLVADCSRILYTEGSSPILRPTEVAKPKPVNPIWILEILVQIWCYYRVLMEGRRKKKKMNKKSCRSSVGVGRTHRVRGVHCTWHAHIRPKEPSNLRPQMVLRTAPHRTCGVLTATSPRVHGKCCNPRDLPAHGAN